MEKCPKCGCEILMPVENIIVPEGLQKIVQCFECDYIFLDGIQKRYWDRKHVLHRLQTRAWRAKQQAKRLVSPKIKSKRSLEES